MYMHVHTDLPVRSFPERGFFDRYITFFYVHVYIHFVCTRDILCTLREEEYPGNGGDCLLLTPPARTRSGGPVAPPAVIVAGSVGLPVVGTGPKVDKAPLLGCVVLTSLGPPLPSPVPPTSWHLPVGMVYWDAPPATGNPTRVSHLKRRDGGWRAMQALWRKAVASGALAA